MIVRRLALQDLITVLSIDYLVIEYLGTCFQIMCGKPDN